MGLIRVVDFNTKYLVGHVEGGVVFFLRIDKSLRDMILKSREYIDKLQEEYGSANSIGHIDYTPEYLKNGNNKFLDAPDDGLKFALPFDVDDYFQENGTRERIMLCQSILEVSCFGFGWRGTTERGDEIHTDFFDFSVLKDL